MPRSNSLFSLEVYPLKKKIKIILRIFGKILYTSEIPQARATLKDSLPTIFEAKCYNHQNIPFYREVAHTELGHLFEHILLEYLCDAKISRGYKHASFSGITNWNWKKDQKGTFNITLNLAQKDSDFLPEALTKSTALFHSIITPTQ